MYTYRFIHIDNRYHCSTTISNMYMLSHKTEERKSLTRDQQISIQHGLYLYKLYRTSPHNISHYVMIFLNNTCTTSTEYIFQYLSTTWYLPTIKSILNIMQQNTNINRSNLLKIFYHHEHDNHFINIYLLY